MRKIVPAILAMALAASLGGAVLAHAYSAPSTTSLRYDEDSGRFRGRVESPRRPCEDSRKIKLVRHTSSGNDVVGRTRTNSKGRWSIEEENAGGAYSAVVVRRDRTPPGHVHACQRGTSGTVTVDP